MGDEPYLRQVADGEDRIGGAGADVLAGADLALDHRAADKRRDDRLWVDLGGALVRADITVALAEIAQPVAPLSQSGIPCARIGERRLKGGMLLLPDLVHTGRCGLA